MEGILLGLRMTEHKPRSDLERLHRELRTMKEDPNTETHVA